MDAIIAYAYQWSLETIQAVAPVAGWYLLGDLLAFSLCQSMKAGRRSRGSRRLSSAEIRMLAFLCAAAGTAGPAMQFSGMSPGDALMHGTINGVLYPICMTALMAFVEGRWPRFHAMLRVAEKPRPASGEEDPKTETRYF